MGKVPNGVLGGPIAEPGGEFEHPATEPQPHPNQTDAQASTSTESDPNAPSPEGPKTQPAESAEGADALDNAVTSPGGLDVNAVSPTPQELLAAVRGVEQQAKAFHVRAENYEQIIRQMQSRIEQLQGDQVQALLKPVIQRFAGLHAQAVEASEQARGRGEAAEKDFDFFGVAIEEALGLVDIESVAAGPSVEFDPSKHHASRMVTTDDPSLDRRIQRVLRQGFTYVGASRVFLPAQVSIYRYEPSTETAGAGSDTEQDPSHKHGEGAPVD